MPLALWARSAGIGCPSWMGRCWVETFSVHCGLRLLHCSSFRGHFLECFPSDASGLYSSTVLWKSDHEGWIQGAWKKKPHCASCVDHASHLNYSDDTWVSCTQNIISAQVSVTVSCNVLQNHPTLLLLTILTHVKIGSEKTEEPGKCYTPFYIYIYCLFRWLDVHPLVSTLVCYIDITHLYGLVFLLFLLLYWAAHMQRFTFLSVLAQNYCTINIMGGWQNLKNRVKNKIQPNHNVFYSSSAATRSNSFPVSNPSCKWSKWDFCV